MTSRSMAACAINEPIANHLLWVRIRPCDSTRLSSNMAPPTDDKAGGESPLPLDPGLLRGVPGIISSHRGQENSDDGRRDQADTRAGAASPRGRLFRADVEERRADPARVAAFAIQRRTGCGHRDLLPAGAVDLFRGAPVDFRRGLPLLSRRSGTDAATLARWKLTSRG